MSNTLTFPKAKSPPPAPIPGIHSPALPSVRVTDVKGRSGAYACTVKVSIPPFEAIEMHVMSSATSLAELEATLAEELTGWATTFHAHVASSGVKM